MIVDLFCGAGGWLAATQMLGLPVPTGYDNDPDAIATYRAAGGRAIKTDLALPSSTKPGTPLTHHIEGLVGSPPCQPYSKAGKRQGRDSQIGMLPLVCAEWALDLHPTWVALEQVPGAGPIFTRVAAMLAADYHVATYELHAEQYGVPQTRDRIILLAHRDAKPPKPQPTHSRYYPHNPTRLDHGVPPWVTMADALHWGPSRPSWSVTAGGTEAGGGVEVFANADARGYLVGFPRKADGRDDGEIYRERDLHPDTRPAPAVTSKSRSWIRMGDTRTTRGTIRDLEAPSPAITASMDNGNYRWTQDRPSPTIVSEFRPHIVAKPAWRTDHPRQDQAGSVAVTVGEAGILQSFPPDWPWHGSRTSRYRQVGNAIPPRLAAAIIATLEAM